MSIESPAAPQVNGYLLLFRNTNWEKKGLPKDEIRRIMERVNAWFDQLSADGKLLGAQPLFEEGVVLSGKGGSVVTDGPFVEAKEAIGGYVLLAADSMEEAVALAQSNPMMEFGLTTEVRPTATSCPFLDRIFNRAEEVPA